MSTEIRSLPNAPAWKLGPVLIRNIEVTPRDGGHDLKFKLA
ncbi:MAG: hypothetical protein ACR2P1_01470 [Pseudomonadales bacterium]